MEAMSICSPIVATIGGGAMKVVSGGTEEGEARSGADEGIFSITGGVGDVSG